jgi:uncharacterized protein (TIGR03492 family)
MVWSGWGKPVVLRRSLKFLANILKIYPMPKKVLFLSNGHGEDINASAIASALAQLDPTVQMGAMPTVGAGNAYRRLGIEIIGPTKAEIPSGGFSYAHVRWLLADIADGVIGRLVRQLLAVRKYSRDADLVLAMGDEVPIIMAALTGRPFFSFLCSTSAHYEQRLLVSWPRSQMLKSQRCRRIYTRDRFTADCMLAQGYDRTAFVGNPFMDALVTENRPFPQPLLAMLPGSRQPEAAHNLQILLDLAVALGKLGVDGMPVCCLALTPNFLMGDPVPLASISAPWQVLEDRLVHPEVTVYFATDAFADILEQSMVVVGMAGTAIEQAVGLGKAVVQIPGNGPQFTYAFAEAQFRLLGSSVMTIGQTPATAAMITAAAAAIDQIFHDPAYLEECRIAGQGRVGGRGAAAQIARDILVAIGAS